MDDKSRQGSGSTNASTLTTSTGGLTVDNSQAACGCPEQGFETINVEQVLGAGMQQRVVETAMAVPDQKPDIRQVVDVYVKALDIKSISVIPDKVVVRGDIEVKVMYVADLPNEPVHAFEQSNLRWTRDIQVPGAQPGMSATADAAIEYISYEFSPDNPRQVYITIVLKVWTRVVSTAQMDVVTVSPVSEVSQFEVTTASGAEGVTGGGVSPGTVGYGESNVVVTGPGVEQTAGVSMGVSGMATVIGNGVNVRTGPGTNFPVVTQVNKGDQVTLKDQAFGWNKVVLSDGNTTGWIAGWLMSSGETPPAPMG